MTGIASEVDLPRSTVQRLVGALVDEKLLASASDRGGYKLGNGLLQLVDAGTTRAQKILRPVLESLSAATTETVHLALLRDKRAIIVDRVFGTARLVASVEIGTSVPLHATASGKVLLAQFTPAQCRRMLPATLARITLNTTTDHTVLQTMIERVRLTGIAVDIEEYSAGISALGAALSDSDGNRFAISIPVPSARFDDRRVHLEARLQSAVETARMLLARLDCPNDG